MTRTIYIVFPTEICGDTKRYSGASKKYAFLCNYDEVETGDIIVDPRYTDTMLVVDISNNINKHLNGIPLKDIYITSINNIPISQPSGLVNGSIIGSDYDINKQEKNNMETRKIKVSLEQATKWYNSKNEALKELALTVFTKEELTLNLSYIKERVIETKFCATVPANEAEKYNALMDLAMIAKYFNGAWKKIPNNTGYCLAQSGTDSISDIIKGVKIVTHIAVMYPGIVYFREKEALIRAVKIMGDRIKYLFE